MCKVLGLKGLGVQDSCSDLSAECCAVLQVLYNFHVLFWAPGFKLSGLRV